MREGITITIGQNPAGARIYDTVDTAPAGSHDVLELATVGAGPGRRSQHIVMESTRTAACLACRLFDGDTYCDPR